MPRRSVIVFVITALVATGAYLSVSELAGQPPVTSNQVTSTGNSVSVGSSGSYQVLKTNLTIYYGPACIPPNLEGFGCETIDTALHSPSLSGVDLIQYQGSKYYGLNFTGYENGQPDTRDIWFTNSTILCVSPPTSEYPPCPTSSARPRAIVIFNSSASALNSSSGLTLSLQLSLAPGNSSKLQVRVDLFNTQQAENTVGAANSWPVSNDSVRDICVNHIVGYVLYQGHYDFGNFTAGSPLALDPTNTQTLCPAPSSSVYYSFQANSDNATIQGASAFPSGGATRTISVSDSLSGYWTGNRTSSSFDSFLPGIYSVAAMDQWGQVVVLQFEVSGISLQNFSLCPSNCLYPSPSLTGEIYFGGPSLAKSMELFVNGTDEGSLGHGIGSTNVIYLYKGSFQSPQVIAGDAYVIKFVATLADNSTATASTTVVAK